jgi:hypothetical protein
MQSGISLIIRLIFTNYYIDQIIFQSEPDRCSVHFGRFKGSVLNRSQSYNRFGTTVTNLKVRHPLSTTDIDLTTTHIRLLLN